MEIYLAFFAGLIIGQVATLLCVFNIVRQYLDDKIFREKE